MIYTLDIIIMKMTQIYILVILLIIIAVQSTDTIKPSLLSRKFYE